MAQASLWRHADFLKLWTAQAVSALGARVTREGLPFIAIMLLHAGPADLAWLAILSRAPGIFVGVVGGGFVDASRRRPIMVWTDLARAAVLVTIPLAAWRGWLNIAQIDLIAFLIAALSVLFALAARAYLPSLLSGETLVDANAKLSATDSAAEMGGPALYGFLFQVFAAPFALLVNAATYLFSAVFIALVGAPEPRPAPRRRRAPWSGFAEGLAVIWAEPRVRTLLILDALWTGGFGLFGPTYMVMALKVLHLQPWMLGATVMTGGAAALVGAMLTRFVLGRFGIGPAIILTAMVGGLGNLFIPLAYGPPLAAMAMLIAAQLVVDSFSTVFEIAETSLRQSLVAHTHLGRVGGVFALATGLAGVAGAALGGWVGEVWGARTACLIASLIAGLTPLFALWGPLTRVKALPQSP